MTSKIVVRLKIVHCNYQEEESLSIGINLGTIHSCVAVMRHGRVEVIVNEEGNSITPSVVAFNEHDCLVGDAAKDQMSFNPKNTIVDLKRIIGRKFDDAALQNNMRNWLFSVIEGVDGEPRIEVTLKGERKLYAPEELTAMILYQLKEMAEKHLKQEVRDAVITVPASFNIIQRQATLDAAKIAGLNVLRILSEPTAAVIAHRYLNKSIFSDGFRDGANILVYKLGGGTLDVSILKKSGEENTVLATNGKTNLGGQDFDCALVDYCVQEFKRKYKIDLSSNKRALCRLRTACESAKRCLSTMTTRDIVVDTLANGIIFKTTISRSKFEYLNMIRFRATLKPVQQALTDAKLMKKDIEYVVIVGGSTRIPKIQDLLKEFFDNKTLDFSLKSDDILAYGAAVHAAALKDYSADKTVKTVGKMSMDVIPKSLGYDLFKRGDNILDMLKGEDILHTEIVIPKNSTIPISKSSGSVTRYDNQRSSKFTIRQGESSVPDRNVKLGDFTIHGLPLGPRGSVKFNTIFNIDANGILTVTATETSTGKTNSIRVENVTDQSRKERLKGMVEEANDYRLKQKMRRMALTARQALEDECFRIKFSILEFDVSVRNKSGCAAESDAILEQCEQTLQWIQDKPNESRESYEYRLTTLEARTKTLLAKLKPNPLKISNIII